MDVSKEIFKVDKEELHFIINSSTISKLSSLSTHSTSLKPFGETELTVTNLTSDYVAFRVQTTNKKKFAVHPTHEILKPNENYTFKIIYYTSPEKILEKEPQKFKLEGFIIPEEKKNEPAKDLFKEYMEKGIKVQGNFIKLKSKFTLEEDIKENNNDKLESLKESQNENMILRNSMASVSSEYTVPEGQKSFLDDKNSLKLSDLIVNKSTNSKVELSDKEKLENLKLEYNQLKEEVDKLKKNEESLNKKIKNERNKKNIVPESEKFRYNLPDIKEKPFARNILLGIFAFSVLLGFYLVK